MCLRERKRVRTREWEIFGIKHSNTDGSPLHSEATCIALFFQSHSSPNASPPPSTYDFVANSLVRIYLSFLPLTVTRLLFQTHITLARTHTHTHVQHSIYPIIPETERKRERETRTLLERSQEKEAKVFGAACDQNLASFKFGATMQRTAAEATKFFHAEYERR